MSIPNPKSEDMKESTFFTLPTGFQLPAYDLSVTINTQEKVTVGTLRHLTVRILTPDIVINAYQDLVNNHLIDPFQMVLDHLGNPDPESDEFSMVRDWARLLVFAQHIDFQILRDQPVSLDRDVIYTKYGANLIKGNIIDSSTRHMIEREWKRIGSPKKYWSPPFHAIQAYFENVRGLGGIKPDETEKFITAWGILREVAAANQIFDQDESELFAKASFSPYPLFIPFSEEEAWRWRCEELDTLEEFEQFLDQTQKEVCAKEIQELSEGLEELLPEARHQREAVIHKLERVLKISDTDDSIVDEDLLDKFQAIKDQCYRQIWADAHEINMRDHGGDTVPLAQSLEFEMLSIKHAMLSLMCWQVFSQIREQMTREEQRLFMALYSQNPYTWDLVPAFDQTVMNFIRSASETVLGLGMLVLCGYKEVAGEDIGKEFSEYWKTWLWICDLSRSGKIDEITQVLNQEPSIRHQFQGRSVVEISFDDHEHRDLIDTIAMSNGGCAMFQEEAIRAGELSVEEEVFQKIMQKSPGILARLINEYATEAQREVLLLHYFHPEDIKLTQKEIASQLNISQSAVNQRIDAGLKAIRSGMKKEEKLGLLHWQELI